MNQPIFSFLALLLCLSGCAVSGKDPAAKSVRPASSAVGDDFANVPVQKVNDPLQGFNRTMFGFNDELNTHAWRPLAHGYVIVVPRPVRNGISNFFDNVQFPVRFVNSVLQGKLTRSAQEVGKFVFNSTFGVGGLIRVSDHVSGLTDVPAEDFGQTLGVWGLPSGPYIVIPVLGPSDCRDYGLVSPATSRCLLSTGTPLASFTTSTLATLSASRCQASAMSTRSPKPSKPTTS